MTPYIVIATKGRPQVVHTLLNWLQTQTVAPQRTIVVGASEADVSGLAEKPGSRLGVEITLSPRAGLCAQRNAGLQYLQASRKRLGEDSRFFVVFLDDDFRPASDWLAQAQRVFLEEPSVIGLTGHVLADGIKTAGISEEDAHKYVSGEKPPMEHWASGPRRQAVTAYGCNMAFRDTVFEQCSFDENLPLYGWQEDLDFSCRARRFGQLIYTPRCKGVHLGVKSGRVSGRRFGYSQIANPWYLMRKGTMTKRRGVKFAMKNIASNVLNSARQNELVDYPGRLVGNALAFNDLFRGRCHPGRVIHL